MADTDIVVVEAQARFRRIDLRHPFVISGRAISWFTLAVVDVVATDRRGAVGRGLGASVLSVPWSWPDSGLDVLVRDAVLRRLVERLVRAVPHGVAADPIAHWTRLQSGLGAAAAEAAAECGTGEHVPGLAASLALGAVDNALHDAWASAAGRPAHTMYTRDHLRHDLGAHLGPSFTGRYPGEFLTGRRRRLPVQHVVGVTDPLRKGDPGGSRSLEWWLREECVRHIKVKVSGTDPASDADRIAAVHRVAAEVGPTPSCLAVDPNEGCAGPEELAGMLDRLQETAPAAYEAVGYVEQPFPRESRPNAALLREQSRRKPVLLDEGLDDLTVLPELVRRGWSGLVVKAAKGQTPALLAHAFARAHGLFVTVQDLTAVDAAFAHSARLASLLDLSSVHLEYNSRQYAPRGNDSLAARHPLLTTVRDGAISLPEPGAGLY
ncbi:enolase C-terminal domain-like protein [Streptomyces sp. NPDC054847]